MKRLPFAVMIPTLLVAIAALSMTLSEFFISIKKPVDFNTLYESELHAGMRVEGDVYALLDTFAAEETWTEDSETGSQTPRETSKYYYIIPIGEESYMGLQVAIADDAAYDAVLNATWDYLTDVTTDLLSEPVRFEGYIAEMDDDLYQYFVEWFQDTGYFGTTNAAVISGYAMPLMLQEFSPGLYPIFAIGVGLLLLNVLFVVLHLRYRKKQRAAAAAVPGAEGAVPAAQTGSEDPWDRPDTSSASSPSDEP